MKAYRHRLIFWPLFCGALVSFFAGVRDDDRIWPVIIPALVTAAIVFMAIYGSDPSRHGSGIARAISAVIGILAAVDLFTAGYLQGCDLAVLVFLAIFAVPMVRATIKSRTNAGHG
jgi:hypothetical protein